ncbi:hypothetical protein [Paenibacillus hexagrammi]|uniref:Uncharacterized protein n=1 Tax=Paenibacillus hexagrammi TaxID=2908839 RepID=A0ABY3SL05_9BACL|nr:hypothetical protein [Paenibacillus sp. YPD9-1]UJF33894.1 hypothetical protein L0M14_01135 [Paenibacillus sp. YPD9-1]
MKRYWKLMILVPFIVLSIGTYYVSASGNNSSPLQFTKIQGDEKEMDPVVLTGQYQNEPFVIRNLDSEFLKKQSFWGWLDARYFYNTELDELAKENRAFMRGKKSYSSFYVDDQVIGYADVKFTQQSSRERNDFRLAVSMYDRIQKTSRSFELNLPDSTLYYTGVEDVQVEGQTMKVMARNTKWSSGNGSSNFNDTDIHLYTVDLHKMSLIKDEILMSMADDDHQRVDISSVNERDPIGKNSFAVFRKLVSVKSSKEPSGDYTLDHGEFISYDYASGKLTTLQNDSVKQILANIENGNVIYSQGDGELNMMSETKPEQPHVVIYDLKEDRVKKELIVPAQTFQPKQSYSNIARITDNRLYMIVDRSGAVGLKILDMDSGTIVYEGVLKKADGSRPNNIMIDNILVQ